MNDVKMKAVAVQGRTAMNAPAPTPSLLDGLKWEDAHDPGRPAGRLAATLQLNGTAFHVEAVSVYDDGDGLQQAHTEEGQSRLDGLCVEYDSPGFQTVKLSDHEGDFVIFITPHGR